MAIYTPEIHFSQNDKRLLKLLSQILLENENTEFNGNIPKNEVVLTDAQAKKLVNLIDKLLNDKNFITKRAFIDELSTFPTYGEGKIKSIYLTGCADLGKSVSIPYYRWNEFKARLGLFHLSAVDVKSISPMKYDHFLKMEKVLFQSLGINPLIIDLLMKYVISSEEDTLKSLQESNIIPRGATKKIFTRLKRTAKYTTPRVNIASAIIFLANSSALFTTRDWSVAGTISCMAGAGATIEKFDNI